MLYHIYIYVCMYIYRSLTARGHKTQHWQMAVLVAQACLQLGLRVGKGLQPGRQTFEKSSAVHVHSITSMQIWSSYDIISSYLIIKIEMPSPNYQCFSLATSAITQTKCLSPCCSNVPRCSNPTPHRTSAVTVTVVTVRPPHPRCCDAS